MKKSLLSIGAVSLTIAMFATGCASTKSEEKNELQEFLVGSRVAEHIEKTNDKGIDAIASSSTFIYKRVGGAMREYIEKIHGDMATILLGRQIRNVDTKDADGIKIAEKILQGLTEVEKKDWTPEKLYTAAKEKRALQFYIASMAETEEGAKLRNSTNELIRAEIAAGEKIYQATLAKEDWAAKIKEMEKLLNDLGEITKNTATLVQDIAQKITAKGNDIVALAQDPAMQKFITETVPLVAKKTFANDARKKEIDAEIDTIVAKSEYKPIMDKKAQYTAELEKLKKDAAVLSDGIGTQVAYTGKAIPWLIKEYTAVSKL